MVRKFRESPIQMSGKTFARNSAWMFGGQSIRLAGGLLVGVWVARYLGPADYGVLNYAIAFSSLFGILASLGLDAIIVQRLVETTDDEDKILGTAFGLRLFGSLAGLLIAVLLSILSGDPTTVSILVAISSGAFTAQALYVIDWRFQAAQENRKSVIAQTIGFLIAAIARIYMIQSGAPVVAFAFASLIEAALVSCALLALYLLDRPSSKWRFEGGMAKTLLRKSWPLILSGFAYTAYVRVDAVMVGQMLGNAEVGIYSAAIRISEAWNFVPLILVTAAFPALLALRLADPDAYRQQLQSLMSLLVAICLIVAIVIEIGGDELIYRLYGPQYAGAGPILKISVWNAVFVALGFASGRWLIAEDLARYALFRNLIGLMINVLLNLLLIPKLGAKGAAISTLIAYICANFLSYAFRRDLHPLLTLNARSLLMSGLFKNFRRFE
ncbi:flippase [Croceicoccus ponticola]|uniref:Flippase n=1 Tax=Croceicoccus ponticola TaxID=2217664 RepID=A0A437GVI4_9SPHN|nr:flippase [Croceicoccus ponticola]RVQ65800.1 flippase [Croceicoccus ponticola]